MPYMKTLKLILLLLSVSGKLLAQEADAITGNWQMPNQQARIRIEPKGEGYAGKLTNARLTIKDRITLGLPTGWLGIYILQQIQYDRPNHWNGIIYDPQSQKTYSCKLQLQNDSTLKVRGYKGLPLFGKTMFLDRVR